MNPDTGSSHHPDANRGSAGDHAKGFEQAADWTAEDLFRQWLKWPVLVTLVLVGAILFETQSLYQAEEVTQAAALEAAGTEIANKVKAHIDSHVQNLVLLVRQIEAKGEGRKSGVTDPAALLDEAEFMRLALPIHQITDSFLAINFIDRDRVIRWVTPVAPNAQAVGRTVGQSQAVIDLLDEAYRTGKPVATPPVGLFQGGTGVATYFPVHMDGKFIGFINGVFRSPDLVGRDSLRNQPIRALALVVRDEDRIVYESQPGAKPINGNHPTEISVRLLNRKWQIVSFLQGRDLAGSASLGLMPVLAASGIFAAIAAGFALAWMSLQRDRFRQERLRFADFASVTSDWFWEQDEHFRFTFISSAVGNFIGMAASNLYGRTRISVGVGDVGEAEMARHLADLEARRPFHDFRYSRYDDKGQKRVLSVSGRPVFDNNGSFTGYRGVSRDITHEVEIEGALKLSEEKYRQIFYSSSAVKIVFDTSSGAVIDANKAACDFYGYQREVLLGMTVYDINSLPAEDVRRALVSVAAGQHSRLAFRHRLASGSERDVEVFPSTLVVDGRTCIYSIVQDVTMRRRLEAELSREIAFRQSLFEALPLPAFVRDTQSRFTDVNPAFERLHGRKVADLLGRTPDVIAPPELAKTYIDSDQELLLNPGSRVFESRGIGQNGQLHHIIIHKATFGPDPTAPDGIIGVIVDETERREVESGLAEANARLALAVEYAGVALWQWDIETGTMEMSEQVYGMFGYAPGEIKFPFNTFVDFVHEDDRLLYREGLVRHFKGLNDRFTIQLRVRHKQGHWVNCFAAGRVPLFSQRGRALRMVGVIVESEGK